MCSCLREDSLLYVMTFVGDICRCFVYGVSCGGVFVVGVLYPLLNLDDAEEHDTSYLYISPNCTNFERHDEYFLTIFRIFAKVGKSEISQSVYVLIRRFLFEV